MDMLSYGGGVQSFAILALVVDKKLPRPDRIIMVDMSPYEPDTIAFTERVAQPLAQSIGLGIEIVKPAKTLQQDLMRGWVVTPFWWRDEKTEKPALQSRRSCTYNQKVKTVNAQIERYAWDTVWLGISADELRRVRGDDEKLTRGRMRTNKYPLIELDMTRADCSAYIEKMGLPVPPKSACVHCPFSSERRLLENIAKDNGTYELIHEAQNAWHKNPQNRHKYLTRYLDKLPNPEHARELLSAQSDDADNSGTCGVCEF